MHVVTGSDIILFMNKLKIGVIGVGHLGSKHANIYKNLPDCSLTAICDINQERLKEISSLLDVCGYLDYKDLLEKVDAVSVATPTITHCEISRFFLKNKIHVLVEKPFTPELKEADLLVREAKKHKLILQVGHIERFNSAFNATKKLIKDPRFIECHRLSHFPNRSLDVGVVLDVMIHDIDIILGLVPSTIKKIEAVGVHVLTKFEDIANARISFKNGCVANLTASRISDEVMRKIRIFQEDTYISLDYKQAEALLYKKSGPLIAKENLPIEKEEHLERELASFLQCILKKQAPIVSGDVARQALAVAITIKNQIWKK